MRIHFLVNNYPFYTKPLPLQPVFGACRGKRNHQKFTLSTLQSQAAPGQCGTAGVAPGRRDSRRERGSYIHTQVSAGCRPLPGCGTRQQRPPQRQRAAALCTAGTRCM